MRGLKQCEGDSGPTTPTLTRRSEMELVSFARVERCPFREIAPTWARRSLWYYYYWDSRIGCDLSDPFPSNYSETPRELHCACTSIPSFARHQSPTLGCAVWRRKKEKKRFRNSCRPPTKAATCTCVECISAIQHGTSLSQHGTSSMAPHNGYVRTHTSGTETLICISALNQVAQK